eukprot:2701434-Amphidinium_carterae.2
MRYIVRRQPMVVVFENVPGINKTHASEKTSPLACLMQKLTAVGYECDYISIDQTLFLAAARPRTRSNMSNCCHK